jgi:hypothetical protein
VPAATPALRDLCDQEALTPEQREQVRHYVREAYEDSLDDLDRRDLVGEASYFHGLALDREDDAELLDRLEHWLDDEGELGE